MDVCPVWTLSLVLCLRFALAASTEFEAVTTSVSLCPGDTLELRCHTHLSSLTDVFLRLAPNDLVAAMYLDDQGRVSHRPYPDCPLGRALQSSPGAVEFTAAGLRLSVPYQAGFSGSYKCKMKFRDSEPTERTVTVSTRTPKSCLESETTTVPPQPGTTTPPVTEARPTTAAPDETRPPANIVQDSAGAQQGSSGSRVTLNYILGILAVLAQLRLIRADG